MAEFNQVQVKLCWTTPSRSWEEPKPYFEITLLKDGVVVGTRIQRKTYIQINLNGGMATDSEP